eukprot:5722380-Pleurochrysis_carterae.AAC.1
MVTGFTLITACSQGRSPPGETLMWWIWPVLSSRTMPVALKHKGVWNMHGHMLCMRTCTHASTQ